MIDALLADFRATDCDRIIAIGGGAVIDMAKILVLEGTATTEEIFKHEIPLEKAYPLIAVPTTCGAGSEVNNDGFPPDKYDHADYSRNQPP